MFAYKVMVKNMQLIEKTEDLEKLCQTLNQEEFVCVDLEFLREHTYFAKLCLIQVASLHTEAIIDPLAEGINLQSFFDLMQNQNVTKVFHSGRQDIEIIYNLSGNVPSPLFDTQIAAQAAGFGESVGYENLVTHLLHISLDKSSRLSDWSKRPLSETQLNYAISDVTHLVRIYQKLKDFLEKNNRMSWIQDDLHQLADINLYKVVPEEMWQKIRHRSHSALFLTTLRELAAWRELRAIRKNVPRQSFIKDDTLLNICAARPLSKEDLAAIRGMRSDLASGKIGDEIIEVMQKVRLLDKANYVTPPKIKDLPNSDSSLTELLKLLLKVVAQEERIVPKMLASDDDLKHFCHKTEDVIPFLSGWRYDIFGCRAEKLCSGKVAIAYNAQTHKIDFIDLAE